MYVCNNAEKTFWCNNDKARGSWKKLSEEKLQNIIQYMKHDMMI
jgi:hypothetical protein